MYKLQKSYFAGDSTLLNDVDVTFVSLTEAVEYCSSHKPPIDFEWRVNDEQGIMVVWTNYGGDEVKYWEDGKIITVKGGL